MRLTESTLLETFGNDIAESAQPGLDRTAWCGVGFHQRVYATIENGPSIHTSEKAAQDKVPHDAMRVKHSVRLFPDVFVLAIGK